VADVPQLVGRVGRQRRVGRHQLRRCAATEDVETNSLRESTGHSHCQRRPSLSVSVATTGRRQLTQRRHRVDAVLPQRQRAGSVRDDECQLATSTNTADTQHEHWDTGQQVNPATPRHTVSYCHPATTTHTPGHISHPATTTHTPDPHVSQTTTDHHPTSQTRVEQPHSLYFRRRQVTALYHFRCDVIRR